MMKAPSSLTRTIARSAPSALPRASIASSSSSPILRHRSFHSYDHPAPSGPFTPVAEAILSAAYRHVPEHGFTQRSLGLGARDAGYLDISPSVLPDGPFSLVKYHLITQREALKKKKDEVLREGMGVGKKVSALTWARLMANQDVIHRWQEALAIMAHPSYIPPSLRELALLSDEIWFLAGDTAVDPSWYTKRGSLSAIYSSTELFMTDDTSPGYVETARFFERRLGELQAVGSTLGAVGQWVGFTASAGVNILRSKGLRI